MTNSDVVGLAERASTMTYAVQHNPNCPMPFLVRLPRGATDFKRYRDTGDALGFGKTFDEAFTAALRASTPPPQGV